MVNNVFDQCTDSCGWTAAFIAAIAYGSFGVPVKSTKHIDVHPLILQSYKTLVVFVTSWLVTFLGVEIGFTKWGLLSGFLWVIGGTGGIYGIRMAGLAIAVGTWASIMIMVNFLFGIVIFREPVYDILGTLASFVLLIIGLVGMALYSAPQKGDTPTPSSSSSLIQNLEDNSGQMTPMEDPLTQDLVVNGERMDIQLGEMRSSHVHAHFVLCGIPLSQRQCGILGAAMNGVFTGSSLVPLHYAKEEGFGGANFMISMASGSMIANILVWCCFFGFTTIANQTTWQDGLQRMPRWYFKELWFPGFMAGLLLAIAMFGSILAVTYLGQGVGNSLVQTKILVSGLWGIFFYKEVRGTKTIAMWFLSATVAVLAIIWLSLERLLAQGQQTGH